MCKMLFAYMYMFLPTLKKKTYLLLPSLKNMFASSLAKKKNIFVSYFVSYLTKNMFIYTCTCDLPNAGNMDVNPVHKDNE